jgi:hypothetical protein
MACETQIRNDLALMAGTPLILEVTVKLAIVGCVMLYDRLLKET